MQRGSRGILFWLLALALGVACSSSTSQPKTTTPTTQPASTVTSSVKPATASAATVPVHTQSATPRPPTATLPAPVPSATSAATGAATVAPHLSSGPWTGTFSAVLEFQSPTANAYHWLTVRGEFMLSVPDAGSPRRFVVLRSPPPVRRRAGRRARRGDAACARPRRTARARPRLTTSRTYWPCRTSGLRRTVRLADARRPGHLPRGAVASPLDATPGPHEREQERFLLHICQGAGSQTLHTPPDRVTAGQGPLEVGARRRPC